MIKVLEKLASALGKKDEAPNLKLAKEIAGANDTAAVKDLIENLKNKDKNIQSDCIKVIYEIAALNPKLIAKYAKELTGLLDSKNNRLQWGAMTALHAITIEIPKAIYNALPKIISVADNGSVITNDHCVGILIKLSAIKEYSKDAFSLLLERLVICPENQLPMYAENALPVVNDSNKVAFIKTLTSRLNDIEKDTKKARVEKVIRKSNAI